MDERLHASRTWYAAGVSIALGMLLTGCGSTESPYPPTVPVDGTVTYQGEPLEGALVTFKRAEGKGAVGRTDAAGHFQLTTYVPNDGAEVGSYQVEIVKYAPQPEGLPDGVTPPLHSEIPERYGKAKTSTLQAEVGTEGGSYMFELK